MDELTKELVEITRYNIFPSKEGGQYLDGRDKKRAPKAGVTSGAYT